MNQTIHTVTLNPALDRILYLTELKKNVTNRMKAIKDSIGGKGAHVSINLRFLGSGSVAWGVCRGPRGEKIIELLREYGVDTRFIHKKQNDSRMNYLLIEDNGDCMILSEKGAPFPEEDFIELVSALSESFREGEAIVLSGDISNCPPDYYSRILKAFKDKHPKAFLDASGEALAVCIQEAPYLLKPNLDELSSLCGREVSENSEDVLEALDSISHYNVQNIAVSLGGEGSILKTPKGIWKAVPPAVDVKNTIGCGDCYLAGLVLGFLKGMEPPEALRYATAASAAAAEWTDSVGFSRERPSELMKRVNIMKLF